MQLRRIGFLSLIAFLFIDWLLVLSAALHIGFVSDDFFMLFGDRDRPWYSSSDPLYRPLRNGFLKLFGRVFGMHPEPYRVLSFVTYLLCGILFLALLRRLGLSQVYAICAVILVLFDPRMSTLLYWFATYQDIFVAACVMGMLLLWVQYRKFGKANRLAACVFLYGIALGFKETAIVTPALILMVDAVLLRFRFSFRTLRPYFWFGLPVAAFLAFVVFYRLSGLHPAGSSKAAFYGATSLPGTMLAELRDMLNLMLPFAGQFSLREVRGPMLLKVVAALGCAGLLVLSSRWLWREWLLALAWATTCLLPVCLFARQFNQNYYLFLATFGVAAVISLSIAQLAKRRRWLGAVFLWGCVVYAIAGTAVIHGYAPHWAYEAEVAQGVVDGAKRLLAVPGPFDIAAVNLPESFENGFRGALIANGYDSRTTVDDNAGESPGADQSALVKAIAACPSDAKGASRILLVSGRQVTDHTSLCGQELLSSDQSRRAWAWHRETR